MFIDAIDSAAKFTRAIHTIYRYFDSTEVIPGTSSLFFVNKDGWALTCKHVAQTIASTPEINDKYDKYKADIASSGKLNRGARKRIARKHGFDSSQIAQIKNALVNCIEGKVNINAKFHPDLDLSLLHFKDFDKLLCDNFPVFAANDTALKPGKFLCRLGFPFPEFTNYHYDSTKDELDWTKTGRSDSPRFPIEGMVTRRVGPDAGKVTGFELSTPGLRGQSGGPVFDMDGHIWGMQAQTASLDLDFDVDTTLIRKGKKKPVQDFAFLHVGRCIHLSQLKEFMRDKGVTFTEEN